LITAAGHCLCAAPIRVFWGTAVPLLALAAWALLVSDRVLQRVEAGAGRPGVVLEAGRNDVATSWQPVVTLLAPRVHVIVCDRAGLGFPVKSTC
jgi:hypothetical protein